MLNLDMDDEVIPSSGTLTRKSTRSGSRGSFQNVKAAASGSGTLISRPRVRTSSKGAASAQLPTASTFSEKKDLGTPTEQVDASGVGHFVTHSQRALEKIVSSRLVETFVTLTLQTPTASRPSSRPASPSVVPVGPRKGKDTPIKRAISASSVNHRKGASTSSTSSTLSMSSSSHSIRSHPSSSISPRVKATGTVRRPASSRPTNFPSPPPTPPPSSPRLRPNTAISNSRTSQGNNRQRENGPGDSSLLLVPTPFYISPTHHPSTNPTFSHLDPEREFASWADTGATRVKVAIWGRSKGGSPRPSRSGSDKDTKGKGKEVVCQGNGSIIEEPPWKVLDEWTVDLDDMEPLSPDVCYFAQSFEPC